MKGCNNVLQIYFNQNNIDFLYLFYNITQQITLLHFLINLIIFRNVFPKITVNVTQKQSFKVDWLMFEGTIFEVPFFLGSVFEDKFSFS